MMSDDEWAQFTDFCSEIRAKTQDDADVIKASIEMDMEELDRVTALVDPHIKPSEEAVNLARVLVEDLIKQLFASGDEVNIAKMVALEEQKTFMIKQLAKGYEVDIREG